MNQLNVTCKWMNKLNVICKWMSWVLGEYRCRVMVLCDLYRAPLPHAAVWRYGSSQWFSLWLVSDELPVLIVWLEIQVGGGGQAPSPRDLGKVSRAQHQLTILNHYWFSNDFHIFEILRNVLVWKMGHLDEKYGSFSSLIWVLKMINRSQLDKKYW